MKYRIRSDAKTGRLIVAAGIGCAVLAIVPIKCVLMIASGILIGTGMLMCSHNK
ncbi:MAG: hypothetical protein IKM04_06705 [Clostridia bacterium]|nr:hypothetical protein [Clostridia bacterium]